MLNINTAYQWAITKCNDPNVRYSQLYRNEQTVAGITYYDCSSFVWYALKAANFNMELAYYKALNTSYTGNAFTTANMGAVLEYLGFKHYTSPSTTQWKNGDIMWKTGHCEIVYDADNYYTMGAHDDLRPFDEQVSIDTTSTQYYWTDMYRYYPNPVSLIVIAAICGNWFTESGINPGAWQDYTVGHPGYGLGQWSDIGNVTRRTQLFTWLSAHNYAQDSGDGQLEFFLYEMYWTPHSTAQYGQQYLNLNDYLSYNPPGGASELEDLTYAFQQGWEGIITPQSIRYTNASTFLRYLGLNAATAPRNPWIAANRPLSLAEAESNALLLYDYFTGGISPTPPTPPVPPPPTRRKSPFWIYIYPF